MSTQLVLQVTTFCTSTLGWVAHLVDAASADYMKSAQRPVSSLYSDTKNLVVDQTLYKVVATASEIQTTCIRHI